MLGKPIDAIGFVADFDPEVASMMEKEFVRQKDGLELIASENIASPAVIAAMGSVLTNKYAEGLPGKRYYGGCEYVDELESLCIERAKALFGAEFANVQPHSGAQANMAVELAILQPGDTMMGMSLANGGHLTHGSPANISGKYYNAVSYDVNHETGLIDYDEIRDLAKKHQPKLIIAGASAYPRAIDFKTFADIAHEVGAVFMVDMAHIAGLVAGGQHMSPVPYADIVTTTTHKTLRGPRGGLILAKEEFAKKLNSAVFPGTQGGPLEHIIAAKAVCLKEAMSDDFKTSILTVSRSRSIVAGKGVQEGPTKNKKPRTIFIDEALNDFVKALSMEEVERAMKTGRRMSEYIFTNDSGMPVHPDTFTKYLRRLYEKNGLPKNFHLHTLRHYCVSTMLHCGVDKQTVAELVGHGDTGFLERTYCHPQFKLKQEAAAQMAEAMFKPVDHSSCNENVILVS